jgi:adenylate cyclase class 2
VYEVELKVRGDHDRVRDRLQALGAAHEATVEQHDTYYDAPDRSFADTDEALRIRRVDGEARLTYKGPLVDGETKTRAEHETTVGDAGAADAVLRGLGYEAAATVEKRRERYALGEYTVTLDTVDGLGEFVEVERVVAEADLDAGREGARQRLRDLDLDPAAGIRRSYLGLLLDDAPE